MSSAGGADGPFELRLTPDSTAWPCEWPERVTLSPVFGVFRGETRSYVPERMCRIKRYQDSFDDYGIECSECGNPNMYDAFTRKPFRYCPNCGARVVGGRVMDTLRAAVMVSELITLAADCYRALTLGNDEAAVECAERACAMAERLREEVEA